MNKMKMNAKSTHLVKNVAYLMILFFMGNFYVRMFWKSAIGLYDMLKKIIIGKLKIKPAINLFLHIAMFPFIYCVFPALVSYLIYKNITLIGFFIGFIAQWIIFLNTNPYPLTQDNKLTIMELIPEKYRPKIQFSLDDLKKSSMREMNVNFPIIIKPSVCSGRRQNVTIMKSQHALDEYFKENKNTANYMVQNYLSDNDYNIEVGVLWEKMPWEKEGKIIEINDQHKFKKNKSERDEQDEQDTEEEMNEKQKTFNYLINDDLNKLFNNISKNIKGFNAGRYDILIKSLKDFQKGDFKILEANGIWGAQATMHENLFVFANWFLKRFVIGLGNMVTLQGYSPWNLLMVMFTSYTRFTHCNGELLMFTLYA
jgi:hypothetical protein